MKGYCSKAETLAKQEWQERSVVMEMTEQNRNTVWRTLTSAVAVVVTDGHNMKNWTGKPSAYMISCVVRQDEGV